MEILTYHAVSVSLEAKKVIPLTYAGADYLKNGSHIDTKLFTLCDGRDVVSSINKPIFYKGVDGIYAIPPINFFSILIVSPYI